MHSNSLKHQQPCCEDEISVSCPSMSLCSTMFTAALSPPNLPAPPSQPVHCRTCSLLYFCCIQEIKCRLEQVLCFLWAVPVYLSFLAGRDLALADPAHPPNLIKNNVFLPLRKGIGRPGEMKRFSQAQNTKGAAELLCLQDSLLLQLSPPPKLQRHCSGVKMSRSPSGISQPQTPCWYSRLPASEKQPYLSKNNQPPPESQ